MIYMELMFIILIFFSLILLIKNYKNLLMILMSMEFLVLTILYVIFSNLVVEEKEYYMLTFMVFFVVEGVMNLSLLICLIHFKGSDFVKNMNLMW